MIKIDYEEAWRELKEDIVLHMEKLEQKHTKKYREHRAGYGEKPTTERPKPKPRPLKG